MEALSSVTFMCGGCTVEIYVDTNFNCFYGLSATKFMTNKSPIVYLNYAGKLIPVVSEHAINLTPYGTMFTNQAAEAKKLILGGAAVRYLATARDALAKSQQEIAALSASLVSTNEALVTAVATTETLDSAKAELDSAKAELDSAKAELDSAKAELDSAKAELSATQVELVIMTSALGLSREVTTLSRKRAETSKLAVLTLKAELAESSLQATMAQQYVYKFVAQWVDANPPNVSLFEDYLERYEQAHDAIRHDWFKQGIRESSHYLAVTEGDRTIVI